MTVKRFDSVPLKATKTDAGFLKGEANVTRVGVFTYRNGDGSERRELRHPDDVFNADSMQSLALAPMTLGHPSGPVTSKNAKALTVGTVGSTVKQDGRFVRAPYAIHDDAAIAEVESGRQQELSCGYNCDLDNTPGTFNGEAYDARQRNIKYNHIAILAKGRAGPEVRIDAADAVCIDRDDSKDQRKKNMETVVIRLDGIDVHVSPQAAQMIKLREDKAAADAKAGADALAAARKDADTQKGRADALDEQVKQLKLDAAPEAIAKKVSARVELVNKATPILSEKDATGKVVAFNADGKSDDDIKRLVIMKVQPQADLKDKSADYVSARFDAALEQSSVSAANTQRVTNSNAQAIIAIANPLNVDGVSPADAAAQKMRDRHLNAWKPQQPAAK